MQAQGLFLHLFGNETNLRVSEKGNRILLIRFYKDHIQVYILAGQDCYKFLIQTKIIN